MNQRIGVLLEVNCETDFVANTDDFKQLCADLAMQIAALNPDCVRREEMDQATIESERRVLREKALAEGKSEQIVDRIVDGQINVTVTNLGGQLAPTEVSVVVEVGTNQSQSKRVLSLDTDESAHFQVPVPAAGTATVRVLLNGATAATGTVQIPGTATATATTAATTTGTPTP